MAEFGGLIITEKARALIMKIMESNISIEFTKIATSSKAYRREELEGIAALEDVVQQSRISEIEADGTDTIRIHALVPNEGLEEGYFVRTIGLYAQDPSEGEILYGVSAEISENGCYVPPYRNRTVSNIYFNISVGVGNSANVTLKMDPGAVVTARQLDKVLYPEYEGAAELMEPESGESLFSLAGKTKKAVAELITHLADRSNPHGVDKDQLGIEKVDNTSDMEKPVSTAQQAALDEAMGKKANAAEFDSHTKDTTMHVTAAERQAWNDHPTINGVEVSGDKRAVDFYVVPFTTTNDMGIDSARNAIGYVSGAKEIYNINDGAMFEQSFSDLWCQQVYGDYRTGQIATRGKNNGTWQEWRRQLDDQNYTRYTPNLMKRIGLRFTTEGSDSTWIQIVPFAYASHRNGMIAFTLRLYQSFSAYDILISGYDYGESGWYTPRAAMVACNFHKETPIEIFFNYATGDDGRIIPFITFKRDSYTGLEIFGVTGGYTGAVTGDNMADTFNISHVAGNYGTKVTSFKCYAPPYKNSSGQIVDLHVDGRIDLGSGSKIYQDRFEGSGFEGIVLQGSVTGSRVAIGMTGNVSEGVGYWFMPLNSGSVNLGNPGARWATIYSTTAVNVSSDSREKTDQKPLDEDLTEKFINGLNPVSYKRIDGTSGRRHHGLIAQEIEDLLESLGIDSKDFAGFVKSKKTNVIDEKDENGEIISTKLEDTNDYAYSLRYEEFIPSMIKMIQMQDKKIKNLEKALENLEKHLNSIESNT